jgi:hypothetical protein
MNNAFARKLLGHGTVAAAAQSNGFSPRHDPM